MHIYIHIYIYIYIFIGGKPSAYNLEENSPPSTAVGGIISTEGIIPSVSLAPTPFIIPNKPPSDIDHIQTITHIEGAIPTTRGEGNDLNNMDLNNMDLKSSLLERLLNSNDIEKMIELLKLISNQESRANLDINTNINTNLDPNINTNANMNTNTNMNKNTNINSAPSDQHTYPDSIHRSGSLSTMGTPRDEKSISGEYIYIYINDIEWSVYVYIYIYIYIYLILNVLYIYICICDEVT
jgi:hypothetical protein